MSAHSSFRPIAVVGMGCVLPGALSPAALWDAVAEGRDLTSSVPDGRWRLGRDLALCDGPASSADRTWSDRGGYVTGFDELFDASGFAVPADAISGLDPVFRWLLHAAREALSDAGAIRGGARAGAIVGNLSFPSAGMSRFAESLWLSDPELLDGAASTLADVPTADPRDRFNSGLPAHLLAAALELGAGAFALDAACASSLYAIKHACDALRDGRADLMLAGAVNCADDLFIHTGFSALQALSRSGQSRPFHADADGLLPAEGAAIVALMRLEDAVADGRTIHGVIRGIGLSNDGRGRGLLVPTAPPQARAIRQAYDVAGLDPTSVTLLECHSTGTVVGDGVEIASSSAVFAGASDLPIGSLKSNTGHLITAAGAAGLIKVLGAMRAGVRPPTLHVERPLDAVADSPFRLLTKAEPWTGLRRAGISAFGFGGNNAHVVVDEWTGDTSILPTAAPQPPGGDIAIVAMGTRVGSAKSRAEFATAIAEGTSLLAADGTARIDTIEMPLQGLRFPPRDLQMSLGQQTLLLAAAQEALEGVSVPTDRTSVLVGMQCDPEVARYGMRWRLAEFARHWTRSGAAIPTGWVESARDAVIPELQAASVLGTMPNIPANRLNSQFDLAGPSHTVSSEELSGVRALELALRALRAGECDAALVGGVDLSCEPIHRAALDALNGATTPGDAAVVLVLKRLDDARRDGDTPLALIEQAHGDSGASKSPPSENASEESAITTWHLARGDSEVTRVAGHAHAASGLVHIAAAAAACARGSAFGRPVTGIDVRVDAVLGQSALTHVRPVASTTGTAPDASIVTVAPTGPMLRLDAHRGAVRLPPIAGAGPPAATHTGAAQAVPTVSILTLPIAPMVNGMQHMVPAPALPSVSGDATPPPRAVSAPVAVAVAPPAIATPAAPIAAVPTAQFPTPTRAPMPHADPRFAQSSPAQQFQLRLAAAHREFMASQSAAQTRFMDLRRRAVETIALARGGGGGSAAYAGAYTSVATAPVIAAPVTSMAARSPAPATTPAAPPAPAAPVAAAPTLATAPTPAPAATTATRPVVTPSRDEHGPPTGTRTWCREDLLTHAGGKISTIFGPEFEAQDQWELQVRMPEPPLLLCDRVTGIVGEPASMGKGTIWTETDITEDAFYMHDGVMPAGVMIESGQADLLLISWLGVDLLNKGERGYRLLGCELTYRGGLPTPGDTLRYDIHVDGHARQGDIRLFFFHYDCRVDGKTRLQVRSGQAGFFSAQELADSAGILWDAETGDHCDAPRLDAPVVADVRTSLSRVELEAFADGRPWDCFGPGFEYSMPHTRTPRIAGGRMLFLDEVTEIDVKGGPWGRGYLRAIDTIEPDDWFFEGHFKNDPCMPGTLMFEGCLQTMAIYMAALGYTINKDGWRFEPVPDEPYQLRCRGQVLPTNKNLVYEIFVEEVIDGPEPTLYADILCTIDGLKAFHCRRMGLRLTPNWPLTSKPELLRDHVERTPVAEADGFAFDYASLLACAWGKPSDAFGPMYAPFDGHRKVARLPGPPYHFMSRVTSIDGPIGGMQKGTTIELEYDIPTEQWYFDENGNATMPFAVLLEAALQPCGWLASFVGSAAHEPKDLMFRNLDGTGTLHEEMLPHSGTLVTKVKITSISKSAGMIIESFEVGCYVAERLIYDMKTVFGFFPPEAFDNQVGLPLEDHHKAAIADDSNVLIDLTQQPERYCAGAPRLAAPMLLMFDRVTGYWPEGGVHGKGRLRAEKDVDPSEWFFKAHFYQDPVQPGSLGIEAMIQLLQFFMLDTGMGAGIPGARFEPLALGAAMTWKYRGQVVPKNKVISTTLDVVETGVDERGPFAIAEASLWVDGKRIYEASNIGMRIVPGRSDGGDDGRDGNAASNADESLDPAVDTWLGDHRPTWTVPALPMMSMVDRLAAAARPADGDAEEKLIGFERVQVKRWLVVDGPTRLRTETNDKGVVALLADDAGEFAVAATGTPVFGTVFAATPDALAALTDGKPVDSPYATGRLFHGPAFHVLRSLTMGSNGASAILDAGIATAPRGVLHQVLLDGATHAIPHDDLHQWCDEIPTDQVAYPAFIQKLRIHGATPTAGDVRCEVRFDGFHGGPRFPAFLVQLWAGDAAWISFRLVEALFPKGVIGSADPLLRQAFLGERQHVPGLRLSSVDADSASRLSVADVRATDWLPGTVAALYRVDGSPDETAERVVAKEHAAARLAVHPGDVYLRREGQVWLAGTRDRPLSGRRITVSRDGDAFVAEDAGTPGLDITPVRRYWSDWFGIGRWPVEDLYYGLIERFVHTVHIEDPEAWAAVRGRSLLYLGNHQVGVESLLFSIIASALSTVPTVTLAKAEHRQTWLGALIDHSFKYPGVSDPGVIAFFDREDKTSLPRIIGELAAEMAGPGKSVMVHVEGTRSLSCATPVTKMSGAFVDMALKVNAPVVPVRFVGALPRHPTETRLEFPLGHGTQSIWIGKPLLPEDLARLNYGERKKLVVDAINALGPSNDVEEAHAGDAEFASEVSEHVAATGANADHATLRCTLAAIDDLSDEARLLVTGAKIPDDLPDARKAWLQTLSDRLWGRD